MNYSSNLDRPFLRTVFFASVLGASFDLLAQVPPSCDSLDIAWQYYLYEGDFVRAKALVSNCGEVNALELRAFIAIKQNKMSLADTLLCKLFQRAKNYRFDPKNLPPLGLNARVQKVKKDLCPSLEKQRFSLRHPPLAIERDTNLLRPYEVNLGVSSNWGRDENVNNPIIFHARGNLAKLAELEFRTIEIINSLEKGQAQLPTLAMRIQFPVHRMHAQLPVFNVILRSSIGLWDWDSDKRGDMKFQKKQKEMRLFFSSFEYWRTFEFHAGVSFNKSETWMYIGVQDTLYEESDNKPNPFLAFQWRAYEDALLLIAWETFPEYKFKDDKPDKPGLQQVITLNLRAFPSQWLALDLGGIWYRDVRKNNYHLSLGITYGFSLRKIL